MDKARACEASTPEPHSIIKSARRPTSPIQPTKLGHIPVPNDNLPFLEVAVLTSKGAQSGSKWDDPPRGGYEGKLGAKVTTGYMMVDTGASLTLLTKQWCAAHNLRVVDPKSIPDARGAGGSVISIIGMVPHLTIRLS